MDASNQEHQVVPSLKLAKVHFGMIQPLVIRAVPFECVVPLIGLGVQFEPLLLLPKLLRIFESLSSNIQGYNRDDEREDSYPDLAGKQRLISGTLVGF